ncbi:MAG: glycosyltransferase [Eubacterium sp.]|nr:glycosyltransferase [Eubacterium sp.]
MTKLTIVMPCYNEGERIYRNIIETITQVEKFCKSFRIIVVNDGSDDESDQEILRAMQQDKRVGRITYKPNRGKGYAVKRGMLAAKSEYVAFLDADLELPPHLLEDFLKVAEGEEKTGDSKGFDIVIGSKMHPDSQVEYPALRKIMSLGYYWFLKILFGLKLKDTQTGIKLFKTDSIQPILKLMKTGRFSFDIEMLAIASKMGLRIKEMPVVVNFSRNKDNKSKISISSIYEMVRDSFRIKLYVSKLKV